MGTNDFTGSSSSSSSSCPRWTHDVFLSFRGEDTRKNFTDHLYTALIQAGIQAFRDDEQLPRGEDISSELLRAIRESQIAVIVFSKHYASSHWCLDELAEIIGCKNKTGQIVLPIFYDVDPSDVEAQMGSFAEAFESHEERFKDEIGRVKKWREALTVAANLSGWDLQNVANGHEAKFIQKIVEDVLRKLNCKYLNVASHPIGIDSRVKDMITLLSIGINNIHIVGMHGMGGIGKTTIAKAVFNQLCNGFEGSCFLSNVKDASEQPNGLVQLQEQLLQDILGTKNLKIRNVDMGINLIKKRLGSKRVLLVFDDLDQQNQLNALVGEKNWFGLGSRIIVTTRDVHLLTQLEVDETYEVKELNEDESLQLFVWHAFRETSPKDEFVQLSSDVVGYVGGVPLALEVLGSYLFRRSISEWRNAIEKLKKIPHHLIQKKLRISFDSLDDDKVKDIFLDIACFFTGKDKHYVTIIFDGCGFFPEIGISILVQRSLVAIDEHNRLAVHDLLRDMGREIIREKSPIHLGKRSRLWFHDDVLAVLQKKLGTEAVEGLTLDVGASKDTFITTEAFAKMRFLRLLQINGVHFSGSCEYLFEELRWLCWHKCPQKYLSLNYQLDNLVVLDMKFSNIREVWKKIKFLKKLKILNLSHCIYLAKTPNFIGLLCLEKLILGGCTSLVEVHHSIGHLERLVFLNLEGCKTLKDLPECICHLKSLEILNISGCSKLSKLPMRLGDMEALTEIIADETAIRELPYSIGNLKNLRTLSLGGLKDEITSKSWFSVLSSWRSPRNTQAKSLLPASFAGLSSLTRLVLSGSGLSDSDISINFGGLSSLNELDLAGNKFSNLPPSIGQLTSLKTLLLNFCTGLLSISELPATLEALHAYGCSSMERLSIRSKTLPFLYLSGCRKLVEIQGLENMENKSCGPIIHMESCEHLANNFKKSLLQLLFVFEFPSICLPESEIPDWFNHKEEGASLSFEVPALSGKGIHGLIIWAIYLSTQEKNGTAAAPFATIRNKGNNTVLTYRRSFLPTIYATQDHSWITCIPFDELPCKKEGGEQLELSIMTGNSAITLVKKCGVHLISNSQGAEVPYGTSVSPYENTGVATIENLDKVVAKRVRKNDEELDGDWSTTEEGCSKRLKMGPDV